MRRRRCALRRVVAAAGGAEFTVVSGSLMIDIVRTADLIEASRDVTIAN